MSKAVAGTKETALRSMREGTAAKANAEVLQRALDIKGKKKGGKGTKKKPKPYGR